MEGYWWANFRMIKPSVAQLRFFRLAGGAPGNPLLKRSKTLPARKRRRP
jgi:hypothetical protein